MPLETLFIIYTVLHLNANYMHAKLLSEALNVDVYSFNFNKSDRI